MQVADLAKKLVVGMVTTNGHDSERMRIWVSMSMSRTSELLERTKSGLIQENYTKQVHIRIPRMTIQIENGRLSAAELTLVPSESAEDGARLGRILALVEDESAVVPND